MRVRSHCTCISAPALPQAVLYGLRKAAFDALLVALSSSRVVPKTMTGPLKWLWRKIKHDRVQT